MAQKSIPRILIEDYNLYDIDGTFFNRHINDTETHTYKIANRHGHTNCLVQINPAELIEENS